MSYIVLLLVLHLLVPSNSFLNPYSQRRANRIKNEEGDPGSPLFYTPYIESGNIMEARNFSRVDFPGFNKIRSFAGFFTVNKTYDSNQFLWYFPYDGTEREEQVILCLQGGPGSSSLFGLFNENGPFEVKNGAFNLRETYWSLNYHVIYIDNPVGTGFSFTNDSRGYCTDQTEVGDLMYNTLIQFFELFPELLKLKLYISGESFAGKYAPALGYTIHKRNPTAKIKLNLAGLMIGNGWCDPINQLQYGDYLYQIGLIDWNQKNILEIQQNNTLQLIKKEAWLDALNAYSYSMTYIVTTIGNISIYNYLKSSDDICDYCELLESSSVRRAIHVGNLTYSAFSTLVYNSLAEDSMKSIAPLISELLDNYDILFYNGQLDIIVAYPLTVNFLRNLNFSNNDEYNMKAKREIVTLINLEDKTSEAIQIGYMKSAGRLTEAVIRNAGHMAPADQPDWCLAIVDMWINGKHTSSDGKTIRRVQMVS